MTVAYLDSLQGSGIRPGLERMRALLAALGHPQKRYPSVIIAGTNGKGSTAATLDSILRTAGYRTGFYSSPHLIEFRERWLLDGEMIREELLAECVEEIRAASESQAITPTYFEALTLVAFVAFARSGIDLAVLEVGMGGRLDATNVVRPRAAVITSVGIDHTEYLGRTIRKIAREKAGVIHRGAIVLTSNDDSCVLDILRQRSAKFDCPLHVAPAETTVENVEEHGAGQRFTLRTPAHVYRLDSPLRGEHQLENVSLSVRAAEELGGEFPAITSEAIVAGVRATRWRGRLERVESGPKTIWVDGAHNAHAVRRIAHFAADHLERPRILVFGIMSDKDIEDVAAAIFPLFDKVVTTIPYPQRSASAVDLGAIAERMGVPAVVEPDPQAAMRAALAADGHAVLVCGSLYLAGEALSFLDRQTTTAVAASASEESAQAMATS
jgi:dihydrofolate synthase/folylpolyglutamate synthase